MRKRLKDLRDLVDPEVDPQLGRRDEFLQRAEKFLAEFAGRPEAAEVKELVRKVEARYAGLAEKALADALQAVDIALARGGFDDAARSFGYVRIRFGESQWFRTTGEARIAAATRKIDEARAAYAASGLNLSDDFSKYRDGSNGSPKWTSQGAGVKGGALEFERGGWAHFDVKKGGSLTAEALVVPKKRTRGEWTACGLVAWKHGGEYWETGLGHGPKGGRYLWLYEVFGGVWHRLHKPCAWEYGRTYKVRMELTADGFTGYVEEPGGKKLGQIGKKFDEKRKASARCRPGVFASGCEAVFDDVSAAVRGGTAPSGAHAKPAADRPKETPVKSGKKTAPAEKAEKKAAVAVKLPGGPAEPLPGETGLPGQWAPGLIAEVFDGHDFRKRVGVRIDRQIDFNFGPAAADLGAPADNFAIRWTGWLLVPR
ncbi:MAG: PA14 domain-containing protein, partial [Planctomycetota bacterium]